MSFLCTVYGLVDYYRTVAAYNRAGVAWHAVNRPDGGYDFYKHTD